MEVCYHLTRSALCLKIKQSAPPKKRVTSGQLLQTPCGGHAQVLIFKAGKAITAAVRIRNKESVLQMSLLHRRDKIRNYSTANVRT